MAHNHLEGKAINVRRETESLCHGHKGHALFLSEEDKIYATSIAINVPVMLSMCWEVEKSCSIVTRTQGDSLYHTKILSERFGVVLFASFY